MSAQPATAAAADPGSAAARLPLAWRERRLILWLGDLLLAAAVAALALYLGGLRSGWDWSQRSFLLEWLRWLLLLAPLWLAQAWASGLYSQSRARRVWQEAALPAQVSAQLLLIWALAYFVPPPWTIVRHVVIFFGLGTALAVGLWRALAARVLSGPRFRRRLIVVGAGRAGQVLVSALREEAGPLYALAGFVDDDASLRGSEVAGLPVLAGSPGLLDAAQAAEAGEIVLAVTQDIRAPLFEALMDAREQGLAVTPMPVLYEAITGRVPVEHIGDHWAVALPLEAGAEPGLYRLARRGFDLSLALIALLVLVLLFPLLALLIRLSSPGPVLFTQRRVGRGGRPFTLYKLRTMREGAEPDGAVWAKKGDPRITGVGRWLRRSRLDELPQAINILRGEMSIIGPRPERPDFIAALTERIPFYRARHAVRPGLTGWAQIHQAYAGSEEETLVKLQYDLYYIKHRSLRLDLEILWRTLLQVLRLAGR